MCVPPGEPMYLKGTNSACHLEVKKRQPNRQIGAAVINAERCSSMVLLKRGIARPVERTSQVIHFVMSSLTMFQEHHMHKRIGDSAINATRCFTMDILIRGVVRRAEAISHKASILFCPTVASTIDGIANRRAARARVSGFTISISLALIGLSRPGTQPRK